MWHTEKGERKLTGAIRRAFVVAVLDGIDMLEDAGEDNLFEKTVLEHVNWKDRPFLVLLIAQAALSVDPAPEVRAWNETVIDYCFEMMYGSLSTEVDLGKRGVPLDAYFYRKVVRDAVLEAYRGEEKPPKLTSKSLDHWGEEIWSLKDQLLVDDDFHHYEEFADMHPAEAKEWFKRYGIHPDYFSDIPPVVSSELREQLRSLETELRRERRGWYSQFLKTGELTGEE